jgi:hypothetical protein
MTNILISQLGVADPIQNNCDGAMLHIYRHYPIDKVILIDTGATKYQKEDFLQTLNSVREIKSGDVKFHQKSNINPASFEVVQNELMSILIEMMNEWGNKQNIENIYLNVSSGTSALVSVVYSIGQIYQNAKMLQVLLPDRVEHSRDEKCSVVGCGFCRERLKNSKKSSVNTVSKLIKTNADNSRDAKNRCLEIPRNAILQPLADYYVNGGYISKVLICEGVSDVNYLNTILNANGIDDVFVCSGGGTTGVIQNYKLFHSRFSQVYALLDGDIMDHSGEIENLYNTVPEECIFMLKKRAIEKYVTGIEGVKEIIEQGKKRSKDRKTGLSKRKVKISEQATIDNLRRLENELMPLIEKLKS